jgi:hypothetical protein
LLETDELLREYALLPLLEGAHAEGLIETYPSQFQEIDILPN